MPSQGSTSHLKGEKKPAAKGDTTAESKGNRKGRGKGHKHFSVVDEGDTGRSFNAYAKFTTVGDGKAFWKAAAEELARYAAQVSTFFESCCACCMLCGIGSLHAMLSMLEPLRRHMLCCACCGVNINHVMLCRAVPGHACRAVLCCAVLCCAVLCCATLCRALLCRAVPCPTLLCCPDTMLYMRNADQFALCAVDSRRRLGRSTGSTILVRCHGCIGSQSRQLG